MTLVIEPNAAPLRVLWAVMLSTELRDARETLPDREGITAGNGMSRIGSWQAPEAAPRSIPGLPAWAQAGGVDAVVWTALDARFNGQDASPSVDRVVEYLRTVTGQVRATAERSAPRQIDTEFRRHIEAALGWAYRPCGVG